MNIKHILLKDILNNNTLYEVEEIDGRLEYILDESGEKVGICEIDDVDFNIVSLNNSKYFEFITGMAKYIVSYAENNPGDIPMLGSSLSNDCIAHYIKAIKEDDIIKVPCVSFNKDNAKGSRAFYRDYYFVMDRHHVCILTTDLVSPIYLSLV